MGYILSSTSGLIFLSTAGVPKATCDKPKSLETRQLNAVLLVVVNAQAEPRCKLPDTQPPFSTQSETATTTTTLATGRVGGGGGNVLNAANLHARACQSAEGRLSTGTGGLGAVTCFANSQYPTRNRMDKKTYLQ